MFEASIEDSNKDGELRCIDGVSSTRWNLTRTSDRILGANMKIQSSDLAPKSADGELEATNINRLVIGENPHASR